MKLIHAQADALARLLGYNPDGLVGEKRVTFYEDLLQKHKHVYPFAMEVCIEKSDIETHKCMLLYRDLYSDTPHYLRIEGDFWLARGDTVRAVSCYLLGLSRDSNVKISLERLCLIDGSLGRIIKAKIEYTRFASSLKLKLKKCKLIYFFLKPFKDVMLWIARNVVYRLVKTFYMFLRRACQFIATGTIKIKKGAGYGIRNRVRILIEKFISQLVVLIARFPYLRFFLAVPLFFCVKINIPAETNPECFDPLEMEWPSIDSEGSPVFNYSVVVWGQDYLDALARFSLPSLLAPGNLPELSQNKPVRFIFYTKKEDALLIKKIPVVQKIAEYATLSFVYIDNLLHASHKHKYCVMTICHNHLLSILRGTKDYIIFGVPDAVFSDNTLAKYEKIVDSGYTYVVSMAGFRVSQEKFEEAIKDLTCNHSLSLTPREAVRLAYACKHPVTDGLFVGKGLHSIGPTILFWDIPQQGAISHAMHLTPILVRVPQSPINIETTCDGDLLIQDDSFDINIYPVRDSDELFVFSCTMQDDLADWNVKGDYTAGYISNALKGLTDVYQRTYFTFQTKIHYADEDIEKWNTASKEAYSFVNKSLLMSDKDLEGNK